MSQENKLYYSPLQPGLWKKESVADKNIYNRNIALKNGNELEEVIPIGIVIREGVLQMEFSTFQGRIYEPVDNILGLREVRGDSNKYQFETDNELLIEFDYFKMNEMEQKPRRIRPSELIMFGIYGDTSEESARMGSHRAMGESTDFYLEGIDTKYDPAIDIDGGMRRFPFWRIGIWGNPVELTQEYLPEPPPIIAFKE